MTVGELAALLRTQDQTVEIMVECEGSGDLVGIEGLADNQRGGDALILEGE